MSQLRSALVGLVFSIVAFAAPVARGENAIDDAHQIHWQRSLSDALAIAAAEDRPIFIAVNMDGESASERIVREEYRDPKFVAATRPFVCLAASLFRHNARDYDENGRRIPCPRLGEITCGEHIALEPQLFEKYLSDGERVAPRHAIVLQDGKKAWDLSLIFDLKDLDAALEKSAQAEIARRGDDGLSSRIRHSAAHHVDPDQLMELAPRRDHLGRLEYEDGLAQIVASISPHIGWPDVLSVRDVIDQLHNIAKSGNDGSIDALRIVCAAMPRTDYPFESPLIEVAHALKLDEQVARAGKDQFHTLGKFPGAPDSLGNERFLPFVAQLDGAAAGTRSTLLACFATNEYGDSAFLALAQALGLDIARKVYGARSEGGGPISLRESLDAAEHVTKSVGALPRENPFTDAMPDEDVLVARQVELTKSLDSHDDDADLCARYAKTALDLARRKKEETHYSQDVTLLLEDAETWFGKALEKKPDSLAWWIERARTAYFRERFADEAAFGRRAYAVARHDEHATPPSPRDAGTLLDDGGAIEALRWIGDGDARQLGAKSTSDPAEQMKLIVESMRTLGLVAASPFSNADDWNAFASFYGTLGLWREDLAILEEGALRLPAAPEIRDAMNGLLWSAGRIDLAPIKADWIASVRPDSAEAVWFAGRAFVLVAEDARRRSHPDDAIAAYATAQQRFERVIATRPDFSADAKWWIGESWLGRGFAHSLAGRQVEAADCLVTAVETTPAIATAKDGLDYEVVDLIDQCLEWRASGHTPVEAAMLLEQLENADKTNPFWATSIADSMLREALRDDGRNPTRVEKDTVDAAGNKIRMPMGLPTDDGDADLRASIEAARRAVSVSDVPEVRQVLAQSATIWAERMLDRNRPDDARAELAEAAPLMGFEPPAKDADEAALRALAAKLRDVLGDARPRFRPGR